MKTLHTVLFCLMISLSAQAQFGVNGKIVIPGDNWQLVPPTSGQEETPDLFDRGWSVGIDYWFRLKNQRIEFLPELRYTQLSNSLPAYAENEAALYSFFFNTNIYFLDLTGDCDCPTWSKEGPTLEKGLFLQLSPGISYWDATIGSGDDRYANRPVAFSIGGGLGFDLGLSDLLTVSPILNVRYFPKVTFDNPPSFLSSLSSESASPLFWSAGLRLGFRLDAN